MPFRDFEFLTGETAARFRLEKREFVLDLADYTVKEDSDAAHHKRERLRPRVVGRGFGGDILEVLSPNRGWFAGVDNHNLWLRPVDGGPLVQLTTNGIADYAWDVEEASWSPDGSRLVAMKVDRRGVAKIPIMDWLGVTESVEWADPHRPTSGGPLAGPI